MPTWRLSKQFRFEASHQLPDHDGLCRRLHGHSWIGWLIIQGTTLHDQGSKRGMLMDYHDMKKVLAPVVERLDHNHLNDVLPNPTSEELARWVFDQCYLPLAELGFTLSSVIIEETCTSRCEYEGR